MEQPSLCYECVTLGSDPPVMAKKNHHVPLPMLPRSQIQACTIGTSGVALTPSNDLSRIERMGRISCTSCILTHSRSRDATNGRYGVSERIIRVFRTLTTHAREFRAVGELG